MLEADCNRTLMRVQLQSLIWIGKIDKSMMWLAERDGVKPLEVTETRDISTIYGIVLASSSTHWEE